MSHILDITRLVSRAHLPFDTGIDRVERAFVVDTLKRFQQSYFLARIGKRFALLDAEGMHDFLKIEASENWSDAKGLDRFRFKLMLGQRRVRTTVRKLARSFVDLDGLQAALSALGLEDFDYTNVGHTNLHMNFLTTLRGSGARNMTAFVHDMIPLDFPQYCRSDRLELFQKNMENISAIFDRVICNSEYTANRVRHWFSEFGSAPSIIVSGLGSPHLNRQDFEPSHFNERPSFAFLGTIEPRKNIDFLLDIWQELGERLDAGSIPNLILMGKRGWETTSVLTRLDRAKEAGYVFELNDLSDKQVFSYLVGCRALLFPSLVEGYGLPAQEALALRVPVIASDIQVFQELFYSAATLMPAADASLWADKVVEMTLYSELELKQCSAQINSYIPVTWANFFDGVYNN